jgi:predicted nuclease of predicted toxin-antitoxin system
VPSFLSDENFKPAIVSGVLRRRSDVRIDRVQDVGLRQADDRTILAWAAVHGCVLLTHDVSTISDPAYERVLTGQRMPGVVVVPERMSIGAAIEGIILMLECMADSEWEGLVHYLPL